MSDPWHWDVERVVQELCSDNPSWHSSDKPIKLPPRDQLAAALRTNEVDGELLLTYHDQAGLCSDLGMKILKHKFTFINAIEEFRLRSQKYRLSRKRQASELDDVDEDEAAPKGSDERPGKEKARSELPSLAPSISSTATTNADPRSGLVAETGNINEDEDRRKEKLRRKLVSLRAEASKQVPQSEAAVPVPIPISPESDASPSASQETARKKRRVAPTLVSTEVNPANRTRDIPTEADKVGIRGVTKTVRSADADKPRHAYLGNDVFTRIDIMVDPVSTDAGPLTEQDREMNIIQTIRAPEGRRLQVHRLFKRHLLRNQGYRSSLLYKPDTVPGAGNPDHDEVLPLYGESDDDEGYDSDVWEQIEAEKKQKEARAARYRGLIQEEINDILDKAIDGYAAAWTEHKLPKLSRKANQTWNDARRFGLKGAIDSTQKRLREYDARIMKYREEYLGQDWSGAKKLTETCAVFEQTVSDREHSTWLLGVLTSPTAPKKPPSMPRNPVQRPRPQKPVAADDEEILTSEAEDDLDDFIDDGDEVEAAAPSPGGSPMDIVGDDDLPDEEASTNRVRQEDPPQGLDQPIEAVDNEPHEDDRPAASSVDRSLVDGLFQGEDPAKADESAGATTDVIVRDDEPTESSHVGRVSGVPNRNPQTPSASRKQDVIDLTTPTKRISTPKTPSGSKDGKRSNRVVIKTRAIKDENKRSSLVMSIDDLGPTEQRIANALTKLDDKYLSFIFNLAEDVQARDIWLDLILLALDNEEGFPQASYDTAGKKDSLVAYILIRLFEMHKNNAFYPLHRYKNLDAQGKQRVRDLGTGDKAPEFKAFIDFLRRLSDRFDWERMPRSEKSKAPSANSTPAKAKGETKSSKPDDAATSSDGNSDAELLSPSKKKKKRKKFVRNREAANLRESDQARIAEQTHRRSILRAKLAQGEMKLGSQRNMIINESKQDDQGFIYVHDEIERRIKEHQVAGVRFLWNQIVDAETRQGCLLAHTMGLGKTMQIITLLVAIAEAASSDDPTISSQIPEELRESRTLVLCPPTLTNNWLDETLSWTPDQHQLGEIFKVDSSQTTFQRRDIVQAWGELGGVLIIGYNLFKTLSDNEAFREILVEGPNLVVADEAHMLKNPKSQIHLATSNFRTPSRIALTGSPLANNVEEYFSMINWVAPNYLGDLPEFRAIYGVPIKDGLSVESSTSERKKALKMLHVLKSTVAPKVNRTTISVLKNDVPPKMEFVLTVPLTLIQRKAYELYIKYHKQSPASTAATFAATNTLGLICAHPFVLMARLKDLKKQRSDVAKGKQKASDPTNITLPQQLISEELSLLRDAEKDKGLPELNMSWKIPVLFAILDECKRLGDAVLLFSHSLGALDYLERVLRKKKCSFERLDGKTPMGDRQNMVKGFNKSQTDVFLISTTAGGLGLNIVGANRVIIFDSKFNPQNEQQAVGRAYRIGQKKHVFVYRFVCGGTFEERLLNQAIWKMQLASRVVDKKNPIPKAQRLNEGFTMPKEPEQKDLTSYCGKDAVLDRVLDVLNVLDAGETGSAIRSITEMNTFEEEDLEDGALLTEADKMEAAEMIERNRARKAGEPLAYPPPPPPSAANGIFNGGQGIASLTPIDLTGADDGRPRNPAITSSSTEGIATTTQPIPQAPVHTPEVSEQSLQGLVSHQHAPLQPIQGAQTHIRHPENSPNRRLQDQGSYWESLPAFKAELSRAFTMGASSVEQESRRRIADEITTATWDHVSQQPPQMQGATKWAVMNAANSQRFVEAVCIGMLDPRRLPQMEPADITTQRDSWDRMTSTHWEAQKIVTSQYTDGAQHAEGDPQHLQNALRRMTSTPKRDEQTHEQPRSHKVDDRKALEAVMERRRAKQYSTQSRDPRLPDWAKDAVHRQGKIAPPPSSASAVASSSTPPRDSSKAKTKTPFK